VAFRNVVFPFVGGGVALLGYAVFSWLRTRRAALALNGPSTLREAGLLEAEGATLHARVAELDLDDLPLVHASPCDSVAAEDKSIGNRFLARATDALSPFGDHCTREREECESDREPMVESERRPANASRVAGVRS
jgi:hypothetical protein